MYAAGEGQSPDTLALGACSGLQPVCTGPSVDFHACVPTGNVGMREPEVLTLVVSVINDMAYVKPLKRSGPIVLIFK